VWSSKYRILAGFYPFNLCFGADTICKDSVEVQNETQKFRRLGSQTLQVLYNASAERMGA